MRLLHSLIEEFLPHRVTARVDELTIPSSCGSLPSGELRGALYGTRACGPIFEAECGDAETFDRARIPDAGTVLAGDEVDLLLERHLRDESLSARERVLPRISSGRVDYRACKHSGNTGQRGGTYALATLRGSYRRAGRTRLS